MIPRAAIVPGQRAVWLLVGAALVALVIGALSPRAWLVAPAFGVALLAMVLLDARLAGRCADLRLIAPEDGEVGVDTPLVVLADLPGLDPAARPQAALSLDPRLVAGGRLVIPLAFADGGWSGRAEVAPLRRGTAPIEAVWLRWPGPLRLAWRQVRLDLGRELRIWPDVSPVRSPALQIFLRDPDQGLVARRFRGEGSEFDALADYQPGMDRRRIDWKSSARHARLLARETEVERNNPVVFAFDCGATMCEPVDGVARLDRAVTAALTTAYIALKGGDRVALYGFAARVLLATPFAAGTAAFRRLQVAAAGLDYRSEEPNFTLALASLAARLQRRSLVVVFSEFTDPTSAELMVESLGRLVTSHVVLFVVLADAELAALEDAPADGVDAVARAVTARTLARQRALVLQRLRQIGVRVVEARHEEIGTRLIDSYLTVKREGAIG